MKTTGTIRARPPQGAEAWLQEFAASSALFSSETRDALQGRLNLGNFDSQLVTVRVTGGEPAWTAPTLLNAWADIGGVDLPAGYRIEPGGWGEIRGRVGGGAVTLPFFTLPVGYRPPYHYHLACLSEDAVGNRVPYHLNISTNGNVAPFQVGAAFYNNYVTINARFQVLAPTAAAAPATGPDWPLRLKLDLWGQPKAVLLVDAIEVADASSPLVRGPVAWALSADGQSAEVQCPWDLQPGRVYELTFLILGGD